VAEAHQLAAAALDRLDERRHVLNGADLLDHAQHLLVRAAMQRAEQSRDAGGHRREWIHVRRAHHAHRAGRAVLLVIGVQDEQNLQSANEGRIRLVARLRHPVDHRQEVLDVRQRVVGIYDRQTLGVTIRKSRDRRRLGQQPDHGDVALLGIEDVARFRIE